MNEYEEDDDLPVEDDYSDDEFSSSFKQITTESGDLLDDSNPFGYDDFDEMDDEGGEDLDEDDL